MKKIPNYKNVETLHIGYLLGWVNLSKYYQIF